MTQLISRLIHVAATLKLADLLTDGPKTAEELAQRTGTNAPALYRVMRTLSSLDLFAEDGARRFTLRPLGETLRTGTPGHAATLVLAGELVTQALDHALYSVQTGKTGFEKAFGVPLFDWLGSHPTEASRFSETMVGFHGLEPAAIAAAYDFSSCQTIADIGGSTGNLLTTVLGQFPGPRGVLFDMPNVVRNAPEFIAQRGLSDRITIEAGSFFDRVPAGADAHILSHVIHDWNDDQCVTILGNCRRAINPGGRLLIVEMVIAAGNAPHPGKMLDMMMLFLPGGQERTEAEYGALLGKAGFRLTRIVPTQSPVSVVEAVPA